MFKSKGIVFYDNNWLYLKCSEELIKYYSWFIKRENIKIQSPRNGAHITIVAGIYDNPKVEELFKYNKKQIEFNYNPILKEENHFWLTCWSEEFSKIRLDLGLHPELKYPFHLTIGRKTK